MSNFPPKVRATAILLAGVVCFAIADSAFAHVQANNGPAQNHVKMFWKFPCSGPPPVRGERDTLTRGDPPNTPPPDLLVAQGATDPEDSGNHLLMGALVTTTEVQVVVNTFGCATAGGSGIESTSPPSASVGSPSGTDIVPSPTAMRVVVERTVTPGPVADVVRLTLRGGNLNTQTFSPGELAQATLKLIVYPDQATADSDGLLNGVGSAFFGSVTLDGATGSLVNVHGFSLADFLVQSDGAGQFTASPVLGLSKVVLVPDANQAVVSMVGDPTVGPSSTTAVQTPAGPDLWLGQAIPNPARGQARIPFAIHRGSFVTLRIYDQQGRLVRDLLGENMAAGAHEARWDGRDSHGRPAANALYFYRLEADGRRLTGKVFSIR